MPRGKNAGNKGQGSKWITRARRQAIYRRDGWMCVWCGALPAAGTLTIDHLAPRSRGGDNHASNLVTCCMRCNRDRGDMPLTEWLLTPRISGLVLLALARALDGAHAIGKRRSALPRTRRPVNVKRVPDVAEPLALANLALVESELPQDGA